MTSEYLSRPLRTVAQARAEIALAKRPRYISTKEAAVLLRKQLKVKWPAVKFSVRFESYSMGSHINVRWTDGPTQRDVEQLSDAYGGDRFDGMIDMQYASESWLLPDGSVAWAGTTGTEGSKGVVAASDSEPPCPGAARVRISGSRPSCSREISPAFEAKCLEEWNGLTPERQIELLREVHFPRWPEERPGYRYAIYMAEGSR